MEQKRLSNTNFRFSWKLLTLLVLIASTTLFLYFSNKYMGKLKEYALNPVPRVTDPRDVKSVQQSNSSFHSLQTTTSSTTASKSATLPPKPKVASEFILDCFGENCEGSPREEPGQARTGNASTTALPLCLETPPGLVGALSKTFDDMNPPSWEDISKNNPNLQVGGQFTPKECQSRYKVAIIIPLRGRETQLRALLAYMHPIWQRQQMDYTVYTISQSYTTLFNRAKLMNVGFKEAMKERTYDCVVFHDVDLMLENDECLYTCHKANPRHIAAFIDKHSYRSLAYGIACRPSGFQGGIQYFGGVSMLSVKQFEKVNGFSNLYWGWGGEDDDLYIRAVYKGYKIENPYGRSCSFHMIKHKRESSNAVNPGRNMLLFHTTSRMDKEGYNTLRYKVLFTEKSPSHTNITVELGVPNAKLKEYMSKDGPCNRTPPWTTI